MTQISVEKTGDWTEPPTILNQSAKKMPGALKKATRKEARGLRDLIRKGIRDQNPGGKAFRKLSPLTLASRRMRTTKTGSRHVRALDVTGELRRGVRSKMLGLNAFVGIRKGLKGSDGRELAQIGRIHEEGSKPISIPMSPRMRRFLAVLYRNAGIAPGGGSGKSAAIVRIPARPFIEPTYQKWRKGFAARYTKRLTTELTGLSS